jgi:alkylhydroperoxidase family enzyme
MMDRAAVFEGQRARLRGVAYRMLGSLDLTVAIGMINSWNRVCIGFRRVHPIERHKPA